MNTIQEVNWREVYVFAEEAREKGFFDIGVKSLELQLDGLEIRSCYELEIDDIAVLIHDYFSNMIRDKSYVGAISVQHPDNKMWYVEFVWGDSFYRLRIFYDGTTRCLVGVLV